MQPREQEQAACIETKTRKTLLVQMAMAQTAAHPKIETEGVILQLQEVGTTIILDGSIFGARQ